MRTRTSYADNIIDWELLLQAYSDNVDVMLPAQPVQVLLAQTLEAVRALKALQDSRAAQRQQTTQELLERIVIGREQARRLRGLAKGLIGTQSERLVQFQVAPLRRRRSRPTLRKPDPVPPVELVETVPPLAD